MGSLKYFSNIVTVTVTNLVHIVYISRDISSGMIPRGDTIGSKDKSNLLDTEKLLNTGQLHFVLLSEIHGNVCSFLSNLSSKEYCHT